VSRARPRLAFRLAFAYVAVFFWMGAYLPYWPVWLAHQGMSPAEVGILLGVAPWTRVLASPLAGRWADRHGRADRLAAVLSIAWVLGLASFALVSSFWGLLLIMIAVGLVHAPIIPLIDGLTIAAEAAGRVRYGPVRLWGSASFIAASWVGGELLELHGEAIVLWLLVGAAAFTALASAWLPATAEAPRREISSSAFARAQSGRSGGDEGRGDEGRGDEGRGDEGRGDEGRGDEGRGDVEPTGEPPFSASAWPFVGFLVMTALLHGSHGVLYAFGTQHWRAHGLDEGTVGLLWAESVLAEIVLFAYAARVDRWLTPRSLWLLAGGAAAVRWAVLASTQALPWLVVVQALHAFTYGALHLGAMAYIRQRVPAGARGRATTLYSAASTGLALGIALPLAGALYDRWGGGAYWAMTGLSLLGMLVALGWRDRSSG
jgi:MFS transporter, PPP family, 3-phenylpropionic acid transporter